MEQSEKDNSSDTSFIFCLLTRLKAHGKTSPSWNNSDRDPS
jgi:hypothetical protein